MTIEYYVSEEDYLNFNLFHSNNSKYNKNVKLMLRYGVAAFYLLTFCILFRGKMLAIITGMILAIAWIALFPKHYTNMEKRFVKKILSEGKNNDFIGNQKLTLKDDCIEGISCDTLSIIKYNAVEKIGYGYGCFFIYIGAIKAFIVPVAAFSDEGQSNEFINILKVKTGVEPIGVL